MIGLNGHRATTFPAFSPDGRFLAAVWDHHQVAVWNLTDPTREPLVRVFPVGTGTVLCLTFLPDGRLFGADEDGGWSMVAPLTGTFRRPQGGEICNGCAVSPDGLLAVGCGWRLWRVHLDPRDVGQDELPRPRELADGFEMLAKRGDQPLASVCWAPDGQFLAVASSARPLPGQELERQRVEVRNLSGDLVRVAAETSAPSRSDLWPMPLLWTADGRHLVALFGRRLHVWAADTGAPVVEEGDREDVVSVAAAPDGRFVLTGDKSGAVVAHETSSGRVVRSLQLEIGPVTGLAVTPDGLTAAAGGERGAVVFDLDF